jgi:hypothetical protein
LKPIIRGRLTAPQCLFRCFYLPEQREPNKTNEQAESELVEILQTRTTTEQGLT